MKKICIFATSDRPDLYINAITCAVQHLGVGAVIVIVISEYNEHNYLEDSQQPQLKATKVIGNISNQLDALQRGKYLSTTRGGKLKESDLEITEGVGVYGKCLDVINQSGATGITIPHTHLQHAIRGYIYKGNCIFDVSALQKNLLVDVVSILLSYGFSDIYNFELKKTPSYGQEDLYHRLKQGESFEYRNLTISDPVQGCLRRISWWVAPSRAILIFTVVFSATFVPVSIFWQESYLWTLFNVFTMIASLVSYFSLFLPDTKKAID